MAAGAYGLFRTIPAAPRSDKGRSESEDLREQIRILERHVRSLRSDQAANTARRSGSNRIGAEVLDSVSAEPHEASDEPPQTQSPEEAKARTAARYEFLDKSFQSEARDPSWSGDVEHEILGVFQDETFANVRLQSASCASSMCKVELVLTDQTEFQEFQMKAAQALQPFLPRGTMREEDGHDGSLAVTAYLVRPEHRLPHWEPVD